MRRLGQPLEDVGQVRRTQLGGSTGGLDLFREADARPLVGLVELARIAHAPSLVCSERGDNEPAQPRRSFRSSPTRMVKPVRSKYSSSAIENFRLAPIMSRNSAAPSGPLR